MSVGRQTLEARMEIDPVCGMGVEDTPQALRAVYEGRTYIFCSESCRERFEESPEEFIDGPGEAT